MMRMALATRQVTAIDFALAKALRLVADETRAVQQDVEGETYVPGGYVETSGHRTQLLSREPFHVAPSTRCAEAVLAYARVKHDEEDPAPAGRRPAHFTQRRGERLGQGTVRRQEEVQGHDHDRCRDRPACRAEGDARAATRVVARRMLHD